MEHLPQIAARIESLDELGELFRAMRAVAAMRVQEAQAALEGIRRYTGTVEDAIAEAEMLAGPPGFPTGGGGGAGVLLAVCSEHGFTGGFDNRIIARAVEARAPGEGLAVVGARGAVRAGEHGLEPDLRFAMATHAGGVLGVTREIMAGTRGFARVRAVHGRYRREAEPAVDVRPILPLDPALLGGRARRHAPLHHLDPRVLLDRLAREYLFAEIARALTESLVCENLSRLRLMQAADRNIGDILERLRSRRKALRQQQITAELLDVVIGAEAAHDAEDGLG